MTNEIQARVMIKNLIAPGVRSPLWSKINGDHTTSYVHFPSCMHFFVTKALPEWPDPPYAGGAIHPALRREWSGQQD